LQPALIGLGAFVVPVAVDDALGDFAAGALYARLRKSDHQRFEPDGDVGLGVQGQGWQGFGNAQQRQVAGGVGFEQFGRQPARASGGGGAHRADQPAGVLSHDVVGGQQIARRHHKAAAPADGSWG
jgi:hypothetical protein